MNFILLLVVVIFSSCQNDDTRFLPKTNEVCFQLISGEHLSVSETQSNLLTIRRGRLGPLETFYIEDKKGALVKIKTQKGHYLNYMDDVLTVSPERSSTHEVFRLVPHKEYFKIQTLKGKNLTLNKENILTISNTGGVLLRVGEVDIYPASWYSIKEIRVLPFVCQTGLFILVTYLFFRVFKNRVKTNRTSFCTVLVLGFILIFAIINTKHWETNSIIENDTISYYEYLPAAVIFKDLSFEFKNNLPEDFNGTIWVNRHEETGRHFPITSMGLAYMYLPSFLVGHAAANVLGYTTYGYSNPYKLALLIGCWLYVFMALFYLRKILLTYFSERVTILTLVSITLATNLFFYTTIENTMSHAYSFFLFALFLWQMIKWHKAPKILTTIALGLIIGLISLVRPTNALIALVFIFFKVESFATLTEKVMFFWKFKWHILVLIFFGLVAWFPQLAFWKYATDQWFFFSYGDDNNFYFNNPHILDGLFSYRKGWLLYTPIMVFALAGVLFIFKKERKWFLPLLIFITLNTYIMYSWWCWWYGGSFGSRPMVDSYALMAIPLAAFYTYFDKKAIYLRIFPILLIVLATGLNLFQTQQSKTCLHWDGMTKEAYWSNFTTLGYPKGIDDMLDVPDYKKARQGIDEYEGSF